MILERRWCLGAVWRGDETVGVGGRVESVGEGRVWVQGEGWWRGEGACWVGCCGFGGSEGLGGVG